MYQLEEDGGVILIDQTLSFIDDYNERYKVWRQDIKTGLLKRRGFTKYEWGYIEDCESDEPMVKPIVQLVVARLLDESVDSKQLFQALKDEGYHLEGYSIYKNYLGVWKLRNDETGATSDIMKLLQFLEREDPTSMT